MKIKNLLIISAGSLVLALTVSSCQKDQLVEAGPTNNKMSQAQQIATYLAQLPKEKNMGNGAIFVDPLFPSGGFGTFQDLVIDPGTGTISSGEFASFSAPYGNNDFWRENPDGTISVHLVSNQATAEYENFGTGEAMSGDGNCNLKYTGELITVQLPFPPFDEITFLIPTSNHNALSVHGHANVTLDGLPGPKSKLGMKLVQTPGGQNHASITLK